MKPYHLVIAAMFVVACGGNKSESPKALPAGSAGSVGVQGGMGFYGLQASGLPPAIVTAGSSVFQVRVFGDDDGASTEVDISGGKGQKAKLNILALSDDIYDAGDKIVLIKQIEFCESQNIEYQQKCPFSKAIHQGTAFVAGDGSTLWTAAHVVEPFMNFIESTQSISKKVQITKHQRIGIFIFDSAGQLIFNPFTDKATLKTVPRITMAAQQRAAFYAEDSDFISLQLSRILAKPLRFASARPAVGQKLFLLGYPLCTGCTVPGIQGLGPEDLADRSPAPNSDGHGLKVSSGKAQGNFILASFFELSPEKMFESELQHMIFSSADGQHGESGGPTLNESGEVVGIYGGGKTRRVRGTLLRISRSAIPN